MNSQHTEKARLSHREMEDLLIRLHGLTREEPRLEDEQALALAVRGYVVSAAVAVAKEYRVAVEDMVQEGLVATYKAWEGFTPGQAPGKCLYPGYVKRLALQAIRRAALGEVSPVRVTRHARRKVKRAKAAAQMEGPLREVKYRQIVGGQWVEKVASVPEPRELAEVLEERGVSAGSLSVLGSGTLHAALPADTLLGLADARGESEERLALARRAVNALGRLGLLQRYVIMGLAGLGRERPVGETILADELRLSRAAVREARETGLRALRRALEPPRGRAIVRRAPTTPNRAVSPRAVSLGPLFTDVR
ncbi:hypothetical protein [Hyalangium versicolor]|uniref:hypothetical protein n=1 Tax=Hyalangium versicolor TaxID=2861190 RepID=UPI001CCE6985|nr:hypothetical protein [Hyalangium versicolor]